MSHDLLRGIAKYIIFVQLKLSLHCDVFDLLQGALNDTHVFILSIPPDLQVDQGLSGLFLAMHKCFEVVLSQDEVYVKLHSFLGETVSRTCAYLKATCHPASLGELDPLVKANLEAKTKFFQRLSQPGPLRKL